MRCTTGHLVSTGRFRVNSNGKRHDVWLVYGCPACGERRKRRVQRRVREDGLAIPLQRYREDDPELAADHAFALSPDQPVAYEVERPALPEAGSLRASIEQPRPCGVRWDRFLARELTWSRSEVRAAWMSGGIQVVPAARPNRIVRDAEQVCIVLGWRET